MGRIFTFISVAGAGVLVVVIVLAILGLTGHFQSSLVNPPS